MSLTNFYCCYTCMITLASYTIAFFSMVIFLQITLVLVEESLLKLEQYSLKLEENILSRITIDTLACISSRN